MSPLRTELIQALPLKPTCQSPENNLAALDSRRGISYTYIPSAWGHFHLVATSRAVELLGESEASSRNDVRPGGSLVFSADRLHFGSKSREISCKFTLTLELFIRTVPASHFLVFPSVFCIPWNRAPAHGADLLRYFCPGCHISPGYDEDIFSCERDTTLTLRLRLYFENR